jgi:hypothetical protein
VAWRRPSRVPAGLRYNPLLALPEAVRGPARAQDADLDVVTGRRPLVESVLADAVTRHLRLSVRRGVAVTAVPIGSSCRTNTLHVRGARTATGEELAGSSSDHGGAASPEMTHLVHGVVVGATAKIGRCTRLRFAVRSSLTRRPWGA